MSMTGNAAPAERLWNRNYLRIMAANFLLYFSFMLLTPLLPLYMRDTFGADKQMIGLVLSGYTVAALLSRPFSGYIVDSYPRKTVLLTCYFLFAAMFAGYLAAGSMVMFAIFRTLHGAPFGATTVSCSTVAIDVLPSSRRSEGIGYYGLGNNLAMALGPTTAMLVYDACGSYDVLFAMSLAASLLGLVIDSTLQLRPREMSRPDSRLSLDRFFLLDGWSQGLCIVGLAFSYGVLSTYLAIYGQDELGITSGTGLYFTVLAFGLIMSRLAGGRSLRRGLVTRNATVGVLVSLVGYLLFAAVHTRVGYYASALVIGLGNGHMYPAFQTMFVNLAPNSKRGTANSTILTCWDAGVGLGVLLGGAVAESAGYHSVFWMSWVVNLAAVVFFLSYSKGSFLRNRLR